MPKLLVEISKDNLVNAIFESMSIQEIFELIVELDHHIADYGFTSDLLDHFSKELAEEDRIANMSDIEK